MESEPRILQQRVEAVAVGRRRLQALEGLEVSSRKARKPTPISA